MLARASDVPASVRRRRHLLAFALWAVSASLALMTFFVYTGALDVMSTDAATVVLGLPAALLAIIGGIAYGD